MRESQIAFRSQFDDGGVHQPAPLPRSGRPFPVSGIAPAHGVPQTPPAAGAYENLFVFQFSFFRFPFPGGGGITAAKVIRRACLVHAQQHPAEVWEWPRRMGALDTQQERA